MSMNKPDFVPRTDFNGMSLDDLGEYRTRVIGWIAGLESRSADIRASLKQARIHRNQTGVYADADWYRRAENAQRYNARRIRDARGHLTQLNSAMKAAGRMHTRIRVVGCAGCPLLSESLVCMPSGTNVAHPMAESVPDWCPLRSRPLPASVILDARAAAEGGER